MCEKSKTSRVSLVCPDLNMIELLLDELLRCIRDPSVNLRQLQVALHLEWAWILRRHMLLIRPRYNAFIAAGEGHVCFWTNLTLMN